MNSGHNELPFLFHRELPSPVGRLRLVGGDGGLAAVLWERDNPKRVPLPLTVEGTGHPVLEDAARQLTQYFDGERQAFQIRVQLRGTPFQKAVWTALLNVPYGQTLTYTELAQKIGRPSAVRAVGAANGRNPVSIIAACHRILGADGSLTGFAGGLDAKAWLLQLEASTDHIAVPLTTD